MSTNGTPNPLDLLASLSSPAAPGSPETAGNPMEALQAAAGIGQAISAILAELQAGRARTDALIEATNRQTTAVEQATAANQAILNTINELAAKFGNGGVGGILKAVSGR